MKFLKKNWKRILTIVLISAAVLGIVGGTTAFAVKDTKTISASEFSRGCLDENGKYIASNQSIYTKDAFNCNGLRIEPDFEANLTYDVFYYDCSGKLLESRKGLTGVYDEDYPLAKTCRIVIYPEIPEDVSTEDFKIGYFEVYGIANDVKITVDKNQDYLYSESVNLYDDSKAQDGYSFFTYVKNAEVVLSEAEGLKTSGEMHIDGDFNKYDIIVKSSGKSNAKVIAVAATSEDVIVESASMSLASVEEGEWCKLTIEISEKSAAEYVMVSLPSEAECYVFGYNN